MLFPYRKWKWFAIIVCGIMIGGGGLFLYLLRAHPYRGDSPSACVDCHEPENMNLPTSRRALIKAFPYKGKDITKATPQEMRSLVCAQCRVEYYFKGEGKSTKKGERH